MQENQSMQSIEAIQNTLMVDRYRYADLLPCSINELRSMGFQDFFQTLSWPDMKNQGASLSSGLTEVFQFIKFLKGLK